MLLSSKSFPQISGDFCAKLSAYCMTCSVTSWWVAMMWANSREAKWRHACQQTARAVHTGNVWERSWHAESPNMADALVWLREGDVKGAKLPQTSVEKNTIDDLRRWLECRGLTSQKKESHAALVRRYGTVLLSMFSEKFRLIETDKCTCTE